MSFVRACSTGEVASGTALAVTVDDVAVAVVHDEDEWYAVYDECSHAAIPLSEGDVEGAQIECWLHGSRFDLRTGMPTEPPCEVPVKTWTPVVRDGAIFIDVAAPNVV